MASPPSTINSGFLIVLAAFALGAGGAFSGLVLRAEQGVESPVVEEVPQHCLLSNRDNQRQLKDQARSLKDNLREIKNAKREVTKAGRQEDVAKLDALAQQIAEKETILKNLQAGRFPPGEDCLNDVMQEHFYNNNDSWEKLNEIRACGQVLNQLKDRRRGLTQLERNSKNITRRLTKAGLDAAPLAIAIEQSKTLLAEIEQMNNAGQCVEAQEKMNDLNQTVDPYALQGAFDQTANALDQLRRVCNEEAKATLQELFNPILAAMQKGDYQEVNQSWNELNQLNIWDILSRAQDCRTFRGRSSTQFDATLEKLGKLLGEKVQQPPPSATRCITAEELPSACAAAGFVFPSSQTIPPPPPAPAPIPALPPTTPVR